MTVTTKPIITERERGGWMAISPDDAQLHIAVLGKTPHEARTNYATASAAWDRLVAAAEARQQSRAST